jgi:proteic killer suppression protein
MIRSFADDETLKIWNGERSRKRPPDIQPTARRKLRQLDAALRLNDMAVPRGNRLEQLKDTDPPRYSVRINDQWRLCFRWIDGAAEDVGIEDYHKG